MWPSQAPRISKGPRAFPPWTRLNAEHTPPWSNGEHVGRGVGVRPRPWTFLPHCSAGARLVRHVAQRRAQRAEPAEGSCPGEQGRRRRRPGGAGRPLPGPGTRGRPESRVAFYAHRFGVPSLLVALVASGLQPAAFPPPKRAARAVATRGEALRRGPLETAGPPGRKPQSPPLGPVWATGEDAEGRRGDRQLARQGRQTADRGEQGEGLQDATGLRAPRRAAATSHRCAETGTAVGGTTATAFPAPTLPTERGARLPRGSSPEDEDTLGWGRGHRRPTGQVPRAPQEGECLGKPGQARVEHFEAKTNNTFPYKAVNSRTK